ncbi:MAG: GntR family transcriptional regulator [Anaerolineae bacterium]
MAASRDDLFSDIHVDPALPFPYHAQVSRALEQAITTAMHPGERLPSEPRLCELFGVSRPVVRQALDQLERDGLVHRVMGKGTFVAERKIPEALLGSLTGFHEDMVAKGYLPTSRVLKRQRVAAGAELARQLELETGALVIELRRLRFVNEWPIQLVTNFLPYAMCPAVLKADFSRQSLYAFLKAEYGLQVERGWRSIGAVLASEEEALLLEVPVGAPLIAIDSISTLADGTVLEFYQAVHRTDRARFEVELARAKVE